MKSAPSKNYERLSVDTIATALSYVNADDRETWVQMAFALRDELGEDGFSIWDNWSRTGDSYNAADARDVWKSARKTGVGIGSLIKLALDSGFRFESEERHQITPEEAEARRIKREADHAKREEEIRQREERAADKAVTILAAASDAGVLEHPYIVRKKLRIPGPVRVGEYPRWKDGASHVIENALLIPLHAPGRRNVSVQAIFPDADNILARDRDYLPGGRKEGCYFQFGTITAETKTVCVAEGYATGGSAHQATGYPVMVAFDAGNVPAVAKMLREKLPHCEIIILADDDRWHDNPAKPNAGVKKSREAAQDVRGFVAIPKFASDEGKPTDFNDLAVREGDNEVARQILAATLPPRSDEPPSPAADNDNVAVLVDPESGAVSTRAMFDAEGPLQPYLRILGMSEDRRVWIEDKRAGQRRAFTTAQLLKRATLIELAPPDAWDTAIRVGEPNQKFTPDNAVAMVVSISKSLPTFVVPEARKQREASPEEAEAHAGFTILGYDRDEIFVFPFETKQLRAMGRSDMSETGLLSIAPMEFWTEFFPAQQGFNRSGAVDWLFRVAYSRGVFNPDRIRGRGAWRDAGRIVFHMGDRLHVDGEYMLITEMNSRFIYQAERPFPNFDEVPPLTAEEGRDLLDLAAMFRWRVPASAAMLAGWCLLAPLCGAINWRSHIWVTGGAGSGKSTIMERYVHPLMSAIDVYAQGNSTEAGIRQAVGGDAVPVLFDESEQNDEGETKRMQAVLALVRQASSESGARTLKGTVAGKGMHFHVRSMFCLASIQVGIQHQADRERLTVLALRDKEQGNGGQNQGDRWEEIKAALYQIERDPTFARRMVRRSIDMLPTILSSIDVFVRVAAQHFGNQRTGDQYGTLLAGAWCLLNDEPPSDADAADWINQYQWDEYTDPAKVDESELALRALLDAKVRTPNGAELTVYDVVAQIARFTGLAANDNGEEVAPLESAYLTLDAANQLLARYGMRVRDGRLLLSNTSAALVNLVRHTKYAADLRGVLSRLDGVTKDAGVVRINGTNSRCLGIPLQMIL